MKTGITVMIAAVGALSGSSLVGGLHVPFIAAGYAPPAACTEWYNGCNMCHKTQDGGSSCTNRVCENAGRGFCTQYATSTGDAA